MSRGSEVAGLAQSAVPDDMIARRILIGATLGAAALIGFGLVMWVAANWSGMDRMTRFALVGGAFAAGCLAALAHSSLRAPGGLVALLGMGGLFALFGQTYQSGSDPWELFALWAALALPLALAARHDAVWTPWSIIAFTGLPLWLGVRSSGFWALSTSDILLSWAIALAILGGLFVLDRKALPAGQARWAFRLATLLGMGLIAASAMSAIFASTIDLTLYASALLLLAAALVAFYHARPMEFGLMAATALAIDGLLISGLLRLLVIGPRSYADAGSYLFVGLLSAGIVAASAAMLLKFAPSANRNDSAEAADGTPVSPESSRTWPVTVLSGIGALLAAVPLLIFLGLLFSGLWNSSSGMLVTGALVLIAALVMIGRASALGFRQQLGFILMLVGYILIGMGLTRLYRMGGASLIMTALFTGGAVIVPVGWIRNLLGAASAIMLAIWLETNVLGAHPLFALHGRGSWIAVSLAAGCGLLALGPSDRDETSAPRGIAATFIAGFSAAAIVSLAVTAGQTFLLGGGSWGPGIGQMGGTESGWSLWRGLSLFCALASLALLVWRGGAAFRSPVALASGAAALALSGLTTNLGPALLLLAAAFVAGRQVLAGLAAVAGLWIAGTFYYWLGWPLVQKAYLMVGLGLALAAVTALGWSRRATGGLPMAAVQTGLRPALAAALIAVSGLAAAGVVGVGIREKEALIATGRRIYLPLAPVDPRSLMQGDYMALRFALPADRPEIEALSWLPQYAIATLDARSVATLTRIVAGTPSTAAGELAVRLKVKNRRLIAGTDAWYFPEGQARTFEAARFGEFRVGAGGEMILVGLADKDLAALR